MEFMRGAVLAAACIGVVAAAVFCSALIWNLTGGKRGALVPVLFLLLFVAQQVGSFRNLPARPADEWKPAASVDWPEEP